jgi:uncharacterized membrane protein YgaE (UPF0421/DUF939 family)
VNTENVIQLFWVVIFFFSILILFFIWAKSVVISRLFVRIKALLARMDTLYDEEVPSEEKK